MIAMIVIGLLFVSELWRYVSVHTREHIQVDTTVGSVLPIQFNITFHNLRCSRMCVLGVL